MFSFKSKKAPLAHIYDSDSEYGDDGSECSNSMWQDKADTFEKRLKGALSLDERTGSLLSLESMPRAGVQRLGQLVGNKFGKENNSLTEDEELDASIASVESFRFEPQRCQAPTFIKVPKMNLFQSYESWDNVLSNIFQSWDNILPDDASSGSLGKENLDPYVEMDKENLDHCVEMERIRTLQRTAKHCVEMERTRTLQGKLELSVRGDENEEEKEDYQHTTFHIDAANAISTDNDGNTEATFSAPPSMTNKAPQSGPMTNKAPQSGLQKKKWRLFRGGRKGTTRESEQKRGDSDDEGATDLQIPEFEDDAVEAEAEGPQVLPAACIYTPVDEQDDKNYCGRDLCVQSLVTSFSFH